MYRKFSGIMFYRYLVELARGGTGESQDDTDSKMYKQESRNESETCSRI